MIFMSEIFLERKPVEGFLMYLPGAALATINKAREQQSPLQSYIN